MIIVVNPEGKAALHAEGAAAKQNATAQRDVKRTVTAENAIRRHCGDTKEVNAGGKVHRPGVLDNFYIKRSVELDRLEELHIARQREAEAVGRKGKAADLSDLVCGVQGQLAAGTDINDAGDVRINRHVQRDGNTGDVNAGVIQASRTRCADIKTTQTKDDVE